MDQINNDSDKHDDKARILREEATTLEREAQTLENTAHNMEERAHELEERAREIQEAHGRHDAKVRLTVVVNGTPTTINASPHEKLGEIRTEALEKSKNLAQPPDNWEIKNEAGDVLNPAKTVGDYHLTDDDILFLSLAAGVAGD